MTKRPDQSFLTFLRIVKTQRHNQNAGSQRAISVDLEWDDARRPVMIHDLLAATNAFKALIELNQAATPNFDERQQRKFSQLTIHAERLQDMVHFIADLVDEETAS